MLQLVSYGHPKPLVVFLIMPLMTSVSMMICTTEKVIDQFWGWARSKPKSLSWMRVVLCGCLQHNPEWVFPDHSLSPKYRPHCGEHVRSWIRIVDGLHVSQDKARHQIRSDDCRQGQGQRSEEKQKKYLHLVRLLG